MQNKLQELTEKIYQEGITRGKQEAETIISGARAESEKLIREAEAAAAAILSKAEKDAEELKKNTLSELRITFRHASSALKQDIEHLVTRKVVDEPVSDAFSDTPFMAGLIESTVEKWAAGSGETGMEVYIPEEMADKIDQYIRKKMSESIGTGLAFHPVKSMKKGFEISPAGKDYKISVTEDDFATYLKEFLRPRLVDLLFEKGK